MPVNRVGINIFKELPSLQVYSFPLTTAINECIFTESFMLVPYHDKVELSRAVQQCLQTLVDAQSFLPTVTYTSFMEQVLSIYLTESAG